MKKRLSARRAATFLATLGALVMSSGIALMVAATPANADAEIHKSYVCKYKNTPGGGTELIQTGQNPIWVDNNSLDPQAELVQVGDTFNDAQGFSVVIIANTEKLDPEPGIEACAPGEEPPPVCPEDSTANAGEVIPEGQTAEEFCNAVVEPPEVCPEGTDNEGVEIPEGQTAEEFCDDPEVIVEPPTTPTVIVSPPTTKTPTVTTPTVVSAGLTDVAKDMRGEQGLALVFAGMLLLLGAGGLGLRVRGGVTQA